MMAQHVPRDDPMNEDDEEELEALEAAANAALAAADALMNPSVEQEASEMARIKQRYRAAAPIVPRGLPPNFCNG